MDIAALHLAVTDLRGIVERSRHSTPSTVSPDGQQQLSREIDALESRLQSIKQWLPCSDPPALARLRSSLGQVGHTINVALEHAQQALSNTANASQVGLPRNQYDSWRCSTDVRECALLADFTLSVLSLYTKLPISALRVFLS